jgi:plasmid stabilization system protein ParE
VRSRRVFGSAVAATLETYIRATVARIAAFPEIGRGLEERPEVRGVPLVRYPFKIFYTVSGDAVVILHVRHTSRRAWLED